MKELDKIKEKYNLDSVSIAVIDTGPFILIKFSKYKINLEISMSVNTLNFNDVISATIFNELSKNLDYKNYMRSIKINKILNL
jgi:hypothetical protein